MTDSYAAMMGAVLAAPDDNLPRLLLADAWEGGDGGFPADPARGEFVRIQCELAMRYNYGGNDIRHWSMELAERMNFLRRRERDILDSHGMVFLIGILPAGLRGLHQAQTSPGTISVMHADFRSAYTFRRGFVEEVSISWVDWQANGQAILGSCPIAWSRDGLVRLADRPEIIQVVNNTDSRKDYTGYPRPGDHFVLSPGQHLMVFTRDWSNEQIAAMLAIAHEGVRFELPAAHRDEE